MKLRPYVVRQGDYLVKLAAQYGFDPDQVWGLPENKPLQDAGRDPHLLVAGDMLYIPDNPPDPNSLQTGTDNAFTSADTLVKVRVVFTPDGEALANEPYLVEADDGSDVPAGSLDGDGGFEAEVATSVNTLVVRFPNRYEAYTVNIGHLDPVSEPSGVIQRLAHLGYLPITATPTADDTTLQNALSAFQREAGIDESGQADDATTQELVKRHGS